MVVINIHDLTSDRKKNDKGPLALYLYFVVIALMHNLFWEFQQQALWIFKIWRDFINKVEFYIFLKHLKL